MNAGPAPHQLAWAGLVVLAWLALCGTLYWQRARAAARRDGSLHGLAVATDAAVPSLVVAFATQTGFAEEVAWQTAQAIPATAASTRVVPVDRLDVEALRGDATVLFVVSTTGEGDAPDMAAGFMQSLTRDAAAFPGLRYGILALGDRTYANFCGFGRQLDAWLQQRGATPLFARVEVDDAAPAALVEWQRSVAAAMGTSPDASAWDFAPPRAFELVERRHLNPGSPGGPAYCVALQPRDGFATWQAGDIAEVWVGPQHATGIADDTPRREYSIASIPEDGVLELLVRQARKPDGTLGVGSGWLTQEAAIGASVWLRIRVNRAFHVPAADAPLILIGNGTGMAGLRAHIKARARQGYRRNWLLFGERTQSHDLYFGDELAQWHAQGTLERLDLAFSRDGPGRTYVQDRLLAAGDAVRQWVEQGATLCVCGSREGMAEGVDIALHTILGTAGIDALRVQGRYRRDVY